MGAINRQQRASAGVVSLTGKPAEGERREGMRAVGVAVSKLAAPIVARREGGMLARLKAEWGTIIGSDWAEVTWPSALGRDGVLKLRTASGAALELQHRAPLIIERINLFFGRQVVTRVTLVQGPLPLAPARGGPIIRPLTPGEAEALDARLCEVADPELRAALARLGRAVAGSEN
jgi:hypothetical protein